MKPMKLRRSHVQPPRVQPSLSTNVAVRLSAPTAACLVAVKGQVANFPKPVSFKAK